MSYNFLSPQVFSIGDLVIDVLLKDKSEIGVIVDIRHKMKGKEATYFGSCEYVPLEKDKKKRDFRWNLWAKIYWSNSSKYKWERIFFLSNISQHNLSK